MPAKFKCLRCGNCCVGMNLHFSRKDFERWTSKKRFDILNHVLVGVLKKGEVVFMPGDDYVKGAISESDFVLGASGWYDSGEDAKLFDCPYLVQDKSGKKVCSIYRIRPYACRNFPLKRIQEDYEDEKIRKCPALKKYVKARGTA
ncbi:MAG: YkgJ family cysteine cluster protein [Candidatus Altiarchaeota archaeon]